MSYIITCSSKILPSAIAPFFNSVSVLCKFDTLLGVSILPLSLQEEVIRFSSWGDRCKDLAEHSSKRFKPISPIIPLCQCYCRIGKNRNKKFKCIMMLIIRPRIKHFVIPFCWLQLISLRNLFLIKFLNFLTIYYGCSC